MGGGGGTPHPPPLLSFKVGVTLPPICPGNRGVPPPPPVPAGQSAITLQKTAHLHPLVGGSTRTTGCGHAEKVPDADKGGRGVPPHPPPLLSFKVGVTLPPMCRSKWGVPPYLKGAKTSYS